jgi:hypothetical protein
VGGSVDAEEADVGIAEVIMAQKKGQSPSYRVEIEMRDAIADKRRWTQILTS